MVLKSVVRLNVVWEMDLKEYYFFVREFEIYKFQAILYQPKNVPYHFLYTNIHFLKQTNGN